MQVTNSLEEIVPATVERLVAGDEHISNCDVCRGDVLALALSSLEPGYASTNMGRILKRLDGDRAKGRVRIAIAVLAAIDVVKQNPHHAS